MQLDMYGSVKHLDNLKASDLDGSKLCQARLRNEATKLSLRKMKGALKQRVLRQMKVLYYIEDQA